MCPKKEEERKRNLKKNVLPAVPEWDVEERDFTAQMSVASCAFFHLERVLFLLLPDSLGMETGLILF